MRNAGILLTLLSFYFSIQSHACTPYAVPVVNTSVSGTDLNVVVTSMTTWGCTYVYELEIQCATAAYTGVPDYTSGTVSGGPNVNYATYTIDMSTFCPGNYKFRVREKVSSYSSAGPWSAYTADQFFTVAGTALTVSASASPSSICFPGNSTLTATPSNACGSISYTWDNGGGAGQSVVVSPGSTTTYTVTATDAGSCVTVTDQVTVTAAPAVVAGTASLAPASICDGQTTTLSIAGEVGTIQWQSSPDGTTWTDIPGATTDPYVVGPLSPGDDTFFQAVVTSCGTAITNVINVSINPLPVINAGIDQTVCESTMVTVNGSGGTSYSWTGGVTDGVAFTPPVGTTTYTVTGTDANGCQGTDDLDITVNALPAVNAGADQSVCDGNQVTLTGSGAVTYVWSGGITDGVAFTPGLGTTTYTVTGTDANSCVNTDDVDVTVYNLPPINAGVDQTVCDGASVTLSGSGGATYVWTGGITDGVAFTPTVGTTNYTVTGTDANGCQNTDDVDINVNALPVINAGPDQTICDGDMSTVNGSGGVSYSWTGGITDGVAFTPSVGTNTYTVTGTDANTCQNTDDVDIIVNALPAVNGGVDQTVCDGNTVTLSGSGATSYVWSGGVTDGVAFTPGIGTTTYTVTGTDANSCVNTDDVDVTVNPLDDPSFNYTSLTHCITGPNPAPNITGLNGGSFTFAVVSNGPNLDIDGATGTITLANSDVGSYNITYSTAGAPGSLCPQQSTLTLSIVNAPVADFYINDTCANVMDPSPIFINGGTGGVFSATPGLVIDPATGEVDLDQSTTGVAHTITNTIDVPGCAVVTYDDVITIFEIPDATISGSTNICIEDLLPDLTLNIVGGTPNYTLNFNFDGNPAPPVGGISGTSHTISGAAIGTYDLVSIQDGNGCMNNTLNSQAIVGLNPAPVVTPINNQDVCEGSVLNIQGFTADIAGTSFTWDNITGTDIGFGLSGNNSIPGFTATNPSGSDIPVTIEVTPTSPLGCLGTPETFIVNSHPLPIVLLNGDILTGCEPHTVNFSNLSTQTSGSCVWNFGDGGIANACGNVTNIYDAGSYDVSLTVTSTYGCVSSDTYVDYVDVNMLPEADFNYSPQELTVEDTEVEFTNTSINADSYIWTFGDNTPASNVQDPTHIFPSDVPGEYLATLIAINGTPECADTTETVIIIQDVIIFYVPNIFTPDGDNFNETFQPVFISGFDPLDFHLMIFDRWGEVVFESYDASKGWDGTYSDQGLIEDGVYIWQIEFKETMSDKRHTHNGHVTVLK